MRDEEDLEPGNSDFDIKGTKWQKPYWILEIKPIYFVPLCLIVLIVSSWMVYPKIIQSDTIKKLKNGLIFFSEAEADFFWSYVIT